MDAAPLDANAVAGDLAEVFAFDITVASTICGTCHHRHEAATLHAYAHAAGLVLRCPSCGGVQLRFVRAPDRAWLDLGGVDVLEVHLPSGP